MLQFLFSYMYKRDCSSPFLYIHDGVIIWKHFPHCWPVVRGTHRSPVVSPCKGWKCVCSFVVLYYYLSYSSYLVICLKKYCSSSFLYIYIHDGGIMWKHFPSCWTLVWGTHHRWFPLGGVGNTYVSLLCCIIIYITVPI